MKLRVYIDSEDQNVKYEVPFTFVNLGDALEYTQKYLKDNIEGDSTLVSVDIIDDNYGPKFSAYDTKKNLVQGYWKNKQFYWTGRDENG